MAAFPLWFSWGKIILVPLPFLSFDGGFCSGTKQPFADRKRISREEEIKRIGHFFLSPKRELINRCPRLFFLMERFIDRVSLHQALAR